MSKKLQGELNADSARTVGVLQHSELSAPESDANRQHPHRTNQKKKRTFKGRIGSAGETSKSKIDFKSIQLKRSQHLSSNPSKPTPPKHMNAAQ